MNKSRAILYSSFVMLSLVLVVAINPYSIVQAKELISPEEIVGEWMANATLIENTFEDIEHSELKSFQTEDGMTGLQVETTLEKYEPLKSMEVTLSINEDGTGYAAFPGHDPTNESFKSTASSLTLGEDGSLVAYSSGWYTDRDLIMVSIMEFEGNVKKQGNEIIIQGEVVETLEGVGGSAVYSWTASKEIQGGGEPTDGEEPDEEEIPVLTGPEESEDKPDTESGDHASPLATALISMIAGLAGILGGALGFSSPLETEPISEDLENETAEEEKEEEEEGTDPAYKKSKVPDYANYVLGEEGERLTRKPDGLIEASFPNGDLVSYFLMVLCKEEVPME